MLTKENIKTFAFGIMSTAFVGLAFTLKGRGDLLGQALMQIDSARVNIHLAQNDIGLAKVNMDSAQKVLEVIRLAADNARNDLTSLQRERTRIAMDIDKTIDASRQNLASYQISIQTMMNRQRRMLDSLNAIGIHNLIIEPSKTE